MRAIAEFEKWQGLGNDFVIAAADSVSAAEGREWAKRLCAPHWGVGADGLIFALPGVAGESQLTMEIYNADGTRAAMCGNGIRCLAAWAVAQGRVSASDYAISTRAGVKRVHVTPVTTESWHVEVDMGEPACLAQEQVQLRSGESLPSYVVSTGNLHRVVIWTGEFEAGLAWLNALDVTSEGRRLERSAVGSCNVEFIVPHDRELHLRVCELGVGETLACGTGACASVVAALAAWCIREDATVHLRGGDLQIRLDPTQRVWMSGPAVRTFTGIWKQV